MCATLSPQTGRGYPRHVPSLSSSLSSLPSLRCARRRAIMPHDRGQSVRVERPEMPFNDFRQFLDVMRQQGELVDINQPIALDRRRQGAQATHTRRGGKRRASKSRKGTDFPLCAASTPAASIPLIAFETDEKNVTQKVLDGLNNPIKPKISKNGGAPCQDVVLTGHDIDITRFPIPTYAPRMGAPTSRQASWFPRYRRPACRTSVTTDFSFLARTRSRSGSAVPSLWQVPYNASRWA